MRELGSVLLVFGLISLPVLGGDENTPPPAFSYTPTPNLQPVDSDPVLADQIMALGKEIGLLEDRSELTHCIQTRWNHAQENAARQWRTRRETLGNHSPLKEVDHLNKDEENVDGKYLQHGIWKYVEGRNPENWPRGDETITECWRKVYTSTKTDRHLTFTSTNPTAFSFWQKITWDSQANSWSTITLAEKQKLQEDYDLWLVKEWNVKKTVAAQGPDPVQMKIATSYSHRAEENRAKLAHAKDPATLKNLHFQISNDTRFGYERLVWAFDSEFIARALEFHLIDFRKNPWNEPP